MTTIHRSVLPFTFPPLVCGIYAVALLARQVLPSLDGAAPVAVALTADLAVVVPGLFYFLVVRPRRWPWVSVVPVFLVSLAVAGAMVPREHQQFLASLRLLAVPVELAVLAWIAARAAAGVRCFRRESRGGSVFDALAAMRAAARSVVRQHVAAEILAFELAVLYYGLAVWRSPRPAIERALFTGHRQTSYGQVLIALGMAAAVELVAVHVLVSAL